MTLHHMTLWQVVLFPWYVLVLVWLIAALWVKSTKVTEPLASRLAYSSIMAAGFYLLFSHSLWLGFLNTRFVGPTPWIALVGVVLTYAGVGLSIWARMILGENWSAQVTKKVGHELIRTGPYGFVRHPIYTGLLLATIGTALVLGEWRGIIAMPLVLIAESIKARREERFMIEEFGASYEIYRQQTWFIVPGF